MIKAVIWGAAELGIFVKKQLESYFPNVIINAFIDRNTDLAGTKIGSSPVLKVTDVSTIDFDFLIICNLNYQGNEMAKQAVEEIGISKEKIIIAETIWDRKIHILPRLNWEKLSFRFLTDEKEENPINTFLNMSYQKGEMNRIGIQFETDKADIMIEK